MRVRIAALGGIVVVLAGCAPHLGPSPADLAATRERYERQRAAREALLDCALADLDVRAEGRALAPLPRLELRAALAAPDRIRLRAAWLLGTAFDLLAEGDSVRAWVPARRLAVVVDPADAPIEAPARLVIRALAAAWEPPLAAWPESSAVAPTVLTWVESGDTLQLDVGRDALPERLRVRPGAGAGLDVRYERWQSVGGTACPARVRIADTEGRVELTLELTGVEPYRQPGADWFALQLPGEVRRVGWSGLGHMLQATESPW